MSEMRLLELELPESVYDRLRTLAHLRGDSVTGLLTTDAYRMSKLHTGSDEVHILWEKGMTVAQIAAELNWTNSKVSRSLYARGLQANRKRRSK
ncbi:hypothetical protein EV379_1223 [Microterricola gilva]|uniref:Uncharacterized protein n=1 Tax=Microterricola gilva TaxID=393267 RepID=A0A4Q8AK84_9MICO|nr:hypothetical protein [Microterricola gilva]RZU64912.1 hypothetical protein EV379_1223 [Microterricola gilva]